MKIHFLEETPVEKEKNSNLNNQENEEIELSISTEAHIVMFENWGSLECYAQAGKRLHFARSENLAGACRMNG